MHLQIFFKIQTMLYDAFMVSHEQDVTSLLLKTKKQHTHTRFSKWTENTHSDSDEFLQSLNHALKKTAPTFVLMNCYSMKLG